MAEYTGQDLATVPKWLAVQSFISDKYPNNLLGPKCSFVKSRVSSQAFGCFASSSGRYTCAETTDNGRTWTVTILLSTVFYCGIIGTRHFVAILKKEKLFSIIRISLLSVLCVSDN